MKYSVPVVLHICNESRQFALRYLQLVPRKRGSKVSHVYASLKDSFRFDLRHWYIPISNKDLPERCMISPTRSIRIETTLTTINPAYPRSMDLRAFLENVIKAYGLQTLSVTFHPKPLLPRNSQNSYSSPVDDIKYPVSRQEFDTLRAWSKLNMLILIPVLLRDPLLVLGPQVELKLRFSKLHDGFDIIRVDDGWELTEIKGLTFGEYIWNYMEGRFVLEQADVYVRI